MTKLAELNIPPLEGGWINLTEAADRLGFTRSYMYKRVGSGAFETARSIGNQASYVVNESEIENLLTARAAAPEKTEKVISEEKAEKVIKPRKPRAKKPPVEEPTHDEAEQFQVVDDTDAIGEWVEEGVTPESIEAALEEQEFETPTEEIPLSPEELADLKKGLEQSAAGEVTELSIDDILAQL